MDKTVTSGSALGGCESVEHAARASGRLYGSVARLVTLAIILTLELILVSVQVDIRQLSERDGLVGLIADWGPLSLRAFLAFVTLYTVLAYFMAGDWLKANSKRLAGVPIAWSVLGIHTCISAVFAGLSLLLFQSASLRIDTHALAAAWTVCGAVAVFTAAIAFFPLAIVVEFIRKTAMAASVAALGSVAALAARTATDAAWELVTGVTFKVVAALLRLLRSDLVVDPANMTVGTSRFYITILPSCSGLEGAGLMLVFGLMWLWLFRRDYVFPRAFLLIPAGVLLVWSLNAVRIAGLILIGDAGAEGVALGGFHSQAGWISFNAAALGFAFILHRSRWLRIQPAGASVMVEQPASNPTAWYLAPFVAILTAAMVSRALTDGFEWLYPLRFAAAGTALWVFRRRYSELDWRVGPAAPLVGIVVFALWVALDRIYGSASPSSMPASLASLPGPAMIAWITIRVIANVITVPIAEELAFRGYLLRHVASADFQVVDPRRTTVVAIAISSLLFGILHGDRWIAGTVAGVMYALAYRYRGRFGDAVTAHATTNVLLSLWVLFTGDWRFW